jgi:SAM-dependent methyltransferase
MPNTDDVKAWYNHHYAATGLQTMRPAQAYPLFLDVLDARPHTSLLDVSCGAGSLLAAARARDVEPVGIDLSDEAVRLARRVAPGALVTVGAGEALPFRSATFDFVSCLGSLEHFIDMGQGLREMIRVAKPTARLCIMVPNEDFIGWKLLGHQGTAQQDINEHLLPLSAWRQLFEQHGLEVRRVIPDRWHAVKWRSVPGAGAARLLTGPVLEAAWRLLPLRWQYQFVFLLEPRVAHASRASRTP